MMNKKFVVWFKDVAKEDIPIVGGKGANLGEMLRNGFPVPNGFIVTAHSYFHFLDKNKLRDSIEKKLHGVDIHSSKDLAKVASEVQKIILRSPIPPEVAKDIFSAYFQLDGGAIGHPLVAIRSSATAEDLPTASFAGQQETYLNVRGEASVLEKVRECWASLFSPRAIFYRQTNKFSHFQVGIAVPIQRMVESDRSGIMFTIDPVTNDKKKIVIEAIFGLGEYIVQGMVTPDHYEVSKADFTITKNVAKEQEKKMILKGSKNISVTLTKTEGGRTKLTDEEIIKLAKLGEKLEKHYYFPQDSEWAIEKGKIYIVQTRPITTIGKKTADTETQLVKPEDIIVTGDPASPGIASGPVQILQSAKEIEKIKQGDILVAEQTNPDYVPAMKKASAIITERGGRTSHAAIVSRELGIPAVVGASGVMSKLKSGMVVTVNGKTGQIIKGAMHISAVKADIAPKDFIKTATKVYVNLAEPSRAEAIAKLNVDGVGLLRAEFMIADLGIHPRKLIEEKKERVFIDHMSERIATFCRAFAPRPIIYRTTDFKTNEYRNLTGGKAYEPEEPNPMLGFRGAARYVADPRVFQLELEMIKEVRNKMGFKNLHVMIPFVRTPKELLQVKQLISAAGLVRSASFKLYLMVEIPTNVIRLDEFLDVGVDGVSIGSNDLTMLMLGTDRDNSEVAHDFNELDPAVLWALERTVKISHEHQVTSSICGQAPSDYPDLLEKLVEWGITGVSINPDAIDHVRETIQQAEKKLVQKKK